MDTPVTGDPLGPAAEVFTRARPRLFGIAYRVLGSVAEAEDVVQDVWLRWQGADRDRVREPEAYLARAATRRAVDVARSARVRRESYVGPWLPEPVDTGVDPQIGAERREALELAVLVVLQKLTPVQRAAYVLREAFAYPYEEIAAVLELTPVNVRRIVSRARGRLAAERRSPVDTGEHRRLLAAFLAAAGNGDTDALEEVLSAAVVAHADGNGMRGVARVPVSGPARVARISGFLPEMLPGAAFRPAEVNGLPGAVILRAGTVVGVLGVTVAADGIDRLFWLLAPEKVRAYARSSRRALPVP
ncbi:RNA polymerase sigma factor SigJ [Streptomyces sp. SID8352]|uniref:RNA polymerase sigma factor SigJ n=1 Tax=Streptomyces sp. SID8352 TaxID=2690338 RepID=UPI00136C5748|nr:RNA polymerase sigma factor SigJ [Streptomyces sp. SID8352]MYU22969.1 sigma-70 family RNA polymerase sigma factor [Streptomyces sp. SID8352]